MTVRRMGKQGSHKRRELRRLASRVPTSDDSHADWQAWAPTVATVAKRGLKRRGTKGDDSHEDWQAGGFDDSRED